MNERRPVRLETLGDVGETGWLYLLAGMLGLEPSRVLVGFGDDVACLKPQSKSGPIPLVTTDMLVEGTHFEREATSAIALGRKAVAVNVSDIAAMGGRPTTLVAALAAPADYPLLQLLLLAGGIRIACQRWKIDFVGGDTVRGDRLTLAVTLLGEFDGPAKRLPLRSRMREGQRLYVTGTLGDSAAGLAILLGQDPTLARWLGSERTAAWARHLAVCHGSPEPRLEEGQVLAREFDDLAMIDLSDDLCKSVHLLAEASGVGAAVRLHHIPISSELRRFGRATGRDPLELAVCGGEDFELLFATSADLQTVRRRLRDAGIETPVTEIGRAGGKRVRWLDATGQTVTLKWKAYEHFEM